MLVVMDRNIKLVILQNFISIDQLLNYDMNSGQYLAHVGEGLKRLLHHFAIVLFGAEKLSPIKGETGKIFISIICCMLYHSLSFPVVFFKTLQS